MRVRALLVAALLCGAALAVSASARVQRQAALGPWTGTVSVVEDVDYTATPTPYVTHVGYHDQALYTLRGEVSAAGLQVAEMAGSGTGRSTVTYPSGCVFAVDPYYQWSYAGPASVSVSYANGRWVIAPQSVTTTYGGAVQSACPGTGQPVPLLRPAPAGLQDPPAGFQPQGQLAPADASSLSGSETLSFAPPFALPTLRIGTATLTWNLSRSGGTGGGGGGGGGGSSGPPTGTSSGTVLVNNQPYKSGQPIPYGSTVDVTKGSLVLKTEVGTLTVSGGGVSAVFKLLKLSEKGKTLVELRLIKGDFSVCKKAFRTTQAAKPPKKTVRRLFANGKGRFRTRGRYSAAAVRGTNWLTADRCDGTLTSVKQGKVEVNDLVKHKKVLVKAGKSYLASPRR